MRHKLINRTPKIHLRWAWAILGSTMLGWGAVAQSNPPLPGRIVTSYALTSTHDLSYYDPRDWCLLGSTNGGQSWTTLDVKTNQFFADRNQRRVFAITNQTAFNIYRLKVSRVNAELDDPTPEQQQMQLAELELIGPVVGVATESELGTLITCSQAHPLIGPPENAFDHDVRTRWVDLGITEPGGSWIQCQYVPRSEMALLITNINQLEIRARFAATHDLFLERGPRILSNLTARAAKARRLAGYALTSANDVPGRDPPLGACSAPMTAEKAGPSWMFAMSKGSPHVLKGGSLP